MKAKKQGLLIAILLLLLTITLVPLGAQDSASYLINIEPIGHWHVFGAKTLIFSVFDSATAEGVEGLDLVVEIARAHSDSVSTRTVADEQIVDEGDGLYSLEYTASALDAYALVVRFEQDGMTHASQPVAFETARAGEEGIMAEANGTTYVYQVRYNWEPGHIHANDEEPVTIIFELLRGIPTGDDINWEQPWTNSFDHVTDGEAVLTLTTADGTSEELAMEYRGRGIYQAQRIFPADEVGDSADYEIQISLTDAFNGASVSLDEPAILHAVPGH